MIVMDLPKKKLPQGTQRELPQRSLRKIITIVCFVNSICYTNDMFFKFRLALKIPFFILDKSMSEDKNIPNPFGRKGGSRQTGENWLIWCVKKNLEKRN